MTFNKIIQNSYNRYERSQSEYTGYVANLIIQVQLDLLNECQFNDFSSPIKDSMVTYRNLPFFVRNIFFQELLVRLKFCMRTY